MSEGKRTQQVDVPAAETSGKKSKKNIARIIGMIICGLVFVGCAIYIAFIFVEGVQIGNANKQTTDQYVSEVTGIAPPEIITVDPAVDIPQEIFVVDFESLWETNEDVVGWIRISGLEEVSYPIVYSRDNVYYLDHNWDRTYTRYGAIFTDMLNDNGFNDPYTVVYGHNMKNGSMFGGLDKYRKSSFYLENGGFITVYLPEQTNVYKIFSVRVVEGDDAGTYTFGFAHGDSFNSYLQAMARASEYKTGVSVDGNDTVITLSTCHNDDRFVVSAKLVAIQSIPEVTETE